MADPAALSRPIPLIDLRGADQRHEGSATPEERAALAARFGLLEVKSLSWRINSAPWRGGVRLYGQIQAKVVQECVVTLDPVPATLDEKITRGFLPEADLFGEDKQGSEHEIVTDSSLGEIPEALPDPLDIGEVVAEELGVALDPYPRKAGLEDEVVYTATPPGAEPLTEETIQPFAGLADLAKQMKSAKNDD